MGNGLSGHKWTLQILSQPLLLFLTLLLALVVKDPVSSSEELF